MSADATFDEDGRYVAVTDGFTVRVKPVYLPRQSDPAAGRYVWAYEITIENRSDTTAQLISRYWRITDGNGRVEEVEGPGVVGEQPVLNPGESHSYASGCPLPTPSGIMAGHYEMVSAEGEPFRIEVPAFSLDLPDGGRALN
ncbi:MAG: Co2+/Mg2+ efflux protein ApaG [Minwuia sp.]|uniref:Co2+/Mg2+ efflux protein ApaG n=1 Tax=Minwuia sp. TaxID=2493630 RepID=UPI003A884F22